MYLKVTVKICEWSHYLDHLLGGFRLLPKWSFAASKTQISLYGPHAYR